MAEKLKASTSTINMRSASPRVVKPGDSKFPYSKVDENTKKAFIQEIKKHAEPSKWRIMAEILKINPIQIKEIENSVTDNKENSSYSPYEHVFKAYEIADRSVKTLFVQLAKLNFIDAVLHLKPFVHEKYHKVLENDFENISTEVTDEIGASNSQNRSQVPTIQGAVPNVLYKELEIATDSWNQLNLLGKGGFGEVYRGTWTNSVVAIKRIEVKNSHVSKQEGYKLKIELKQAFNELKSLNQCRHYNIVSIFGYSACPDQPYCIIYELMSGGTLEQKLFHNDEVFPWKERVTILLEAAHGLQFLHNFRKGSPIIHGDIKPANILLDDKGKAKIGDFGLARESSNRAGEIISRIFGTRPYLPDEFIISKILSPKVDSYSFGMVLFEVATGKRVFKDQRQPRHLKDMIKEYVAGKLKFDDVMDMTLGNSNNESKVFEILVELGMNCVKNDPCERSDMDTVFKELFTKFKKPEYVSEIDMY